MAKKKNPNSNPKSGGVGFAITALILASVTGFSPFGIIAGVILGLGIGKVASIMGSGLDTTTHNKGDDERRQREAEEKAQAEAAARRAQEERLRREAASRIPLTGDPVADEVITKGLEMIKTIRSENEAIPDQMLSQQMDAICSQCEQIFRTVSESPSKAPQVRKFMNYYLPTTLKILSNYRTMQDRGVSFQEMRSARDATVRGMNMILTATQRQIDGLHKENMMDISTDIDVLEQMLKRDGYTESELNGIRDVSVGAEPRTAMEAQMRTSSVPVMDFPVGDAEEQTGSAAKHRQSY